jgi:PAS domain S-box-containing protein
MLMNKDVNCSNFIGLIGHLREHYGSEEVRKIINGLVDNKRYLVADKENPSRIIPIQEHHLTDTAYWVSHEFSRALFARVKKIAGDSSSLIEVGEKAAIKYFSKSTLFASRIFSTKYVCKQAAKLNERFNRTKEVKLAELTDNSSIFELHYHPNIQVTKDICDWNRGIYIGIAKITGATDVKCVESKCVVDGDEYCVFHMTWRKKPNLFKRMSRRILRIISKELVADYEVMLKDRDQLIDNLTQSEERYREMVENINDVIYSVDINGVVAYISPVIESVLGYHPSEIIGKNFIEFIHPEDLDFVMEKLKQVISGELEPNEYRLLAKSGGHRWIRSSSRPIYEEGSVIGLRGVVIDISERKRLEAQIQASLREKEILLKEINHRVKNNMQVISSLLRLQVSNVGDERVTDALMELQGQVQTMAFVHETLYDSDTLVVIDFKAYISKLASQTFQFYGMGKDRVKLKINTEDIKLGIEQATPLGLLSNELVTNSLKYAFPENRSGEIVIRMRAVEQDIIEFVFSDNGIGIPEGLDWRNADSLGLQLVIILAENQLDGTVSLDRRKGTHFTVKFRQKENK